MRVVVFFSKRDIFYFKVSVVKIVESTRDSSWLARDEFLVVFKGDHIPIYLYIFAIVLLLGTILYCTT